MEERKKKNWLLKYILSRMFSNNTPILLVCIFIAAIFWILIALTKNYTTDMEVQASYTGIPQDKVLVNELPDKLTLKLTASGWQLFRQYLNIENYQLSIDIGRFSENQHIVTNANIDYFSSQLPPNIKIIYIVPSLINFKFDERMDKKVPIRIQSAITLDPQFDFTDSIRVNPDSILVSGPAAFVDTIAYVTTELIELKNINSNQSASIGLKRKKASSVTYESSSVTYHAQVEKFTEMQVEVPVNLVNSGNRKVMLVSKNAMVSYKIPLAKLAMADSPDFISLFEVRADFSKLQAEDKRIVLEITKYPGYLRNVTVSPREVQFLYVN